MDSYKTIEREAVDEYIVKKSRFLGYAKPVTTAEQAVAFIEQIKKKHWDATHNVYAYVLREGQTRRYSDDGEPQGTAGIPALDVLLKAELTDLCVVCTRYFGGIMLGAGGLVRAYGHTAKLAAQAGGIITMARCTVGEVVCDYTYYGRLVPLLCSEGAVVEDTVFADSVTVRFKIPADRFAALSAAVTDTSFGKVHARAIAEKFDKIS